MKPVFSLDCTASNYRTWTLTDILNPSLCEETISQFVWFQKGCVQEGVLFFVVYTIQIWEKRPIAVCWLKFHLSTCKLNSIHSNIWNYLKSVPVQLSDGSAATGELLTTRSEQTSVTGAVEQKGESETCCWHHKCNTVTSTRGKTKTLIYVQTNKNSI